jgi:hypothetical protein
MPAYATAASQRLSRRLAMPVPPFCSVEYSLPFITRIDNQSARIEKPIRITLIT